MVKKRTGGRSGGRISQFSEDQQIEFVKDVEGLSGEDKEDAARKMGISIQTYWNWKKKWKHLIGGKSIRAVTVPISDHKERKEIAVRTPKASNEQIRAFKHSLIKVIMEEDELSKLKDAVLNELLDA